MEEAEIRRLLETDIIELLGLKGLPLEKQNELREQMGEMLSDRITDELLGAMSERQREAFNSLLESDPEPDEVEAFLDTAVPDRAARTVEIIVRFKMELVEQVARVREMVASIPDKKD